MSMPARHDLHCYKGQTYEQNLYFKSKGQPVDLTGVTAKAQIRPAENSETLTAAFAVTVTGADGKVSLALTDEQTAALRDGVYFWDLQISGTKGIRYWVRGKFILEGRVTV